LVGKHEKGTEKLITRQKTEQRHREENEMYGFDEYEDLQQRHEEIRREVVVARPEKMARANRETRPYVARDLSWELARYLDTESFSASASATSDSTSGSERRSG
jgi:hypothetical protein